MIQKMALCIMDLLRKGKLILLVNEGLKVGKGCFISSTAMIDPSFLHLIEIGDCVTITANVKILAHDSSMKNQLGVTKVGKVKICNNVFIGIGSIILPNVVIGSNSIIGAGSVVTKNIPPDVVAAGNPARFIMTIEQFINNHNSLMKRKLFFGTDYTVMNNINKSKKIVMNEQLEKDYGYII